MPECDETFPKGNSFRLTKGLAAFNTRQLPDDFVVSKNDVLCGRGSKCFNHFGNRRFRTIVASYLSDYSSMNSTKLDKSIIIQKIVNHIRESSLNGGFVKLDPNTNRYYEVGDFLAREKTSQAFRDALQELYKSSNRRKMEHKARRSHQLRESNRIRINFRNEAIVNDIVDHHHSSLTSTINIDDGDQSNDSSLIPSGTDNTTEKQPDVGNRRFSIVDTVTFDRRFSITTSHIPLIDNLGDDEKSLQSGWYENVFDMLPTD